MSSLIDFFRQLRIINENANSRVDEVGEWIRNSLCIGYSDNGDEGTDVSNDDSDNSDISENVVSNSDTDDPYLTDKENDRKRKRCDTDDEYVNIVSENGESGNGGSEANDKANDKVDDIYEEDIDSDFYDDEDMEEMMTYYKSIITDEINDEETNTPEERETFTKMYSNFDTVKRYLQPPAKRIKLSVDVNMNSTVRLGYESDLEMK